MTPDQTVEAERTAELNAVAHALTTDESTRLLAAVPRMRGAHVNDVLDEALECDTFVGQTDPFFERYADQMPDLNYAPAYAAYALLLMGERLTVAAVLRLLFRAGVLGTEHEAQVRDFMVEEVADAMARAWDLNYGEPGGPKLGRYDARLMARHAIARLHVIRERDHIDPLS